MDFKLLLEGEEYISENIVEVLPKVFGLHKNFRTGLFALKGITLLKKYVSVMNNLKDYWNNRERFKVLFIKDIIIGGISIIMTLWYTYINISVLVILYWKNKKFEFISVISEPVNIKLCFSVSLWL